MLKIGDFSKLSRISIRMLRHYDEMGLLVPGNVDEFTGYRYYSESQLLLANRINCLKDMGFSLALISEILKTYDNSNAFHQFLMLKKAEMKEQSDKIGRQLLLIDSALNRIRKGENQPELHRQGCAMHWYPFLLNDRSYFYYSIHSSGSGKSSQGFDCCRI